MIIQLIKRIIHNSGGYLYGPGSVPKGVDLFHDLMRFGYTRLINTVFDVGANVGAFAKESSQNLPNANIWCFEPVRSTFEILKNNCSKMPRVELIHSAVGSDVGNLQMTATPGSTMNHVLQSNKPASPGILVEEVAVGTVDAFAREFGVEEIGLLKTDTEGFDAEVLLGAKSMIASGRIFLIFVEVGFSKYDTGHTPFEKVRALLESYEVVGFYGQGREGNFSTLDRCDVLFIHREKAAKLLPKRWPESGTVIKPS